MRGVKLMLLGIGILLTIIIVHLFILSQLLVDPLALIGVALVLIGYAEKEPEPQPPEPEKEKPEGEEQEKTEPPAPTE